MSDAAAIRQDQWHKLLGNILGYQATWITDIGLKSGLFAAIADAGDGIDEATLAATLGYNPRSGSSSTPPSTRTFVPTPST